MQLLKFDPTGIVTRIARLTTTAGPRNRAVSSCSAVQGGKTVNTGFLEL